MNAKTDNPAEKLLDNLVYLCPETNKKFKLDDIEKIQAHIKSLETKKIAALDRKVARQEHSKKIKGLIKNIQSAKTLTEFDRNLEELVNSTLVQQKKPILSVPLKSEILVPPVFNGIYFQAKLFFREPAIFDVADIIKKTCLTGFIAARNDGGTDEDGKKIPPRSVFITLNSGSPLAMEIWKYCRDRILLPANGQIRQQIKSSLKENKACNKDLETLKAYVQETTSLKARNREIVNEMKRIHGRYIDEIINLSDTGAAIVSRVADNIEMAEQKSELFQTATKILKPAGARKSKGL